MTVLWVIWHSIAWAFELRLDSLSRLELILMLGFRLLNRAVTVGVSFEALRPGGQTLISRACNLCMDACEVLVVLERCRVELVLLEVPVCVVTFVSVHDMFVSRRIALLRRLVVTWWCLNLEVLTVSCNSFLCACNLLSTCCVT